MRVARISPVNAGSPRPDRVPRRSKAPGGFTLIEVILAMAIFFGITFILLQIVGINLKIARALQRPTVDAASLAAELSLTNELSEGSESGDFGDVHPGYDWRREITLVGTNGLFEVRFDVFHDRRSDPDSEMVILLYRPDSALRAGGGSSRGLVR